jgi:hypothetical protein
MVAHLYQPSSPAPFAILRIGVAAVILIKSALEWPWLYDLYGAYGIVPHDITILSTGGSVLSFERIIVFLQSFHLNELQSLYCIQVVYSAVALMLLLGLATRTSAVCTWLLHLTFMNTAALNVYGADMFINIALFYCVVMPSGAILSLDSARLGTLGTSSVANTLWLRLLQAHLCLVYFVAGTAKYAGDQWHNGEAIWRALMNPQFRVDLFDASWIAWHPFIAVGLAWGTLILEIGYPVGMSIPISRRAWLLGIISMHIGIGLFLGLYLFAIIMIVLNLAAFSSEAWSLAKRLHEAVLTRLRGGLPYGAAGV